MRIGQFDERRNQSTKQCCFGPTVYDQPELCQIKEISLAEHTHFPKQIIALQQGSTASEGSTTTLYEVFKLKYPKQLHFVVLVE